MGFRKKLMSSWMRKRPDGIKGQGFNGFRWVTGTLKTSTTKHPNKKRKMRLEGYEIKMEDGARIWGALQA